jgi:hypothetical protein
MLSFKWVCNTTCIFCSYELHHWKLLATNWICIHFVFMKMTEFKSEQNLL